MWLRKIVRTTFKLACFGCFLHFTDSHIGSIVLCKGDSMVPTIINNDVVLAENISVFTNSLQKGDIVIARSQSNPQEYICKRMVAMEGDTVINDCGERQHVPKGHVWLEGDNRWNSTDSRDYGPIPDGLLERRVFLRIWPLMDFGTLKHPTER